MSEDINELEKAFNNNESKSSDDLSKEFDELVNKEKLDECRYVIDFDEEDYDDEEDESSFEFMDNYKFALIDLEPKSDLDSLEKSFEESKNKEIEDKIGVKINNEPVDNSLINEFREITDSVSVEKSNENLTDNLEEQFQESLIKPVGEVSSNQNLIKKLLILQIL